MNKLHTEGDVSSLENEIAAAVMQGSPANVTEVTVRLREHEQFHEDTYFAYTHSLKNHFGNCQRLHGHSNVIEVLRNGTYDKILSVQAAQELSGKYLVCEDYLKPMDSKESAVFVNELVRMGLAAENLQNFPEHFCFIQYAGSQGEVLAFLPKNSVIFMNTESSIECISSFVKKRLNLNTSDTVVAYEGLAKGAIA